MSKSLFISISELIIDTLTYIGAYMHILTAIFKIAGSLGLFLYGMKIMSSGIQKSAGERLQKVLNLMTINRFAAVFTGFAITSIIQSSSATTVMIVSFVNAGLLNLAQAIGVIMGANIGTTVTGWIIAIIGFKFSISAIALPAIGIGLPLIFMTKLKKQNLGEAFVGFGLIFLGLDYLKSAAPDIENNRQVLEFIAQFANYGFLSSFLFIIIGALITILVQSSSASMAITLTMAYSGWIDYPTAAALVLGGNIGTTVTAFLASIGTNVNARRASRAHILFNIMGVVLTCLVFSPFLTLVDKIVPGDVWSDSTFLPTHLAMFHTLFNIANTLIFLPFVNQLGVLVEKIVVPKKSDKEKSYSLKYISTSIQVTPEINLLKAKNEITRMVDLVEGMFADTINVFHNPNKKMGNIVEDIQNNEDFSDQMQEQISDYLAHCAQEELNETSQTNVNAMMRIVNELESVGDCCTNLIILYKKRFEKKILFSEESYEDLNPYMELVSEFLDFIKSNMNEHLSGKDLDKAINMEKKVDKYRNTLKKSARKRLQKGANVKAELLYIDIVRHIERIGDHCLNMAEALRIIQ